MSRIESTSEHDLIAEVHEHIGALPLDQQLRILEFVWLNAASHARTALLGNADRFARERARQVASLEKMAATVRADESGLKSSPD